MVWTWFIKQEKSALYKWVELASGNIQVIKMVKIVQKDQNWPILTTNPHMFYYQYKLGEIILGISMTEYLTPCNPTLPVYNLDISFCLTWYIDLINTIKNIFTQIDWPILSYGYLHDLTLPTKRKKTCPSSSRS